MHLTFQEVHFPGSYALFHIGIDLDKAFFYSVPTSFFVIDNRIPRIIRELITEAEGCIKMNFLTGASACTRKAIYELLVHEKLSQGSYDDQIKRLKEKFAGIDEELFEILGHIKDMTSEKVHEQSWDAWDSKHLQLFLNALKAVLHEIYVVPDEKRTRASLVRAIHNELTTEKASSNQLSRAGKTQSA